jgi:hypothetical protein
MKKWLILCGAIIVALLLVFIIIRKNGAIRTNKPYEEMLAPFEQNFEQLTYLKDLFVKEYRSQEDLTSEDGIIYYFDPAIKNLRSIPDTEVSFSESDIHTFRYLSTALYFKFDTVRVRNNRVDFEYAEGQITLIFCTDKAVPSYISTPGDLKRFHIYKFTDEWYYAFVKER